MTVLMFTVHATGSSVPKALNFKETLHSEKSTATNAFFYWTCGPFNPQ